MNVTNLEKVVNSFYWQEKKNNTKSKCENNGNEKKPLKETKISKLFSFIKNIQLENIDRR
jgi:hypothetical protein